MKGQLRLLALALPQAFNRLPCNASLAKQTQQTCAHFAIYRKVSYSTYVLTDYSTVMGIAEYIVYIYGWTLSIRTPRGIVHLCCTCEYF